MYLDIFCAIPRLAFVEPQIILLAPEVYQYHIYSVSTQYLLGIYPWYASCLV